jgi:hypothetical protein
MNLDCIGRGIGLFIKVKKICWAGCSAYFCGSILVFDAQKQEWRYLLAGNVLIFGFSHAC